MTLEGILLQPFPLAASSVACNDYAVLQVLLLACIGALVRASRREIEYHAAE